MPIRRRTPIARSTEPTAQFWYEDDEWFASSLPRFRSVAPMRLAR